jgi:hypothetical protein
MVAAAVYLLCAVTSFACALLLFRAYRRTPVRMLFWCTICFVGWTINNILLFVDLAATPPSVDLSMWRALPALFGLLALIYGLLADARWR